MRIAYVSHVDSRWIKQRPHFIAESMQQRGQTVTYVCSSLVRTEMLIRTQDLSVPVVRIPMLPQRFRRRLSILDPLMSAISAVIVLLRIRPQVVLFTHSRHHWLARHLRRAGVRVFYDCMDLNGLFSDATNTELSDERQLVDVSEHTFCSSEPIAKHIRKINSGANVEVIPNALNANTFLGIESHDGLFVPKSVGYVGAISSWFDFDAVVALLDAIPDLTVRLWGPCDVEIPAHRRLEYLGILPHDEAIVAMRSCSILFMPFQVTDLIQAVDPVKVYEYIATGRPVIVCDYPQLAHFGARIIRYSNATELIAAVEMHVDSPTLNREETTEFIASNSWTVRAEKVLEKIG
jgi:teichuronic acid biosynthesis glycosyltransferase TuaH